MGICKKLLPEFVSKENQEILLDNFKSARNFNGAKIFFMLLRSLVWLRLEMYIDQCLYWQRYDPDGDCSYLKPCRCDSAVQSGVTLMFFACIVWLKLVSYAHTNYDMRALAKSIDKVNMRSSLFLYQTFFFKRIGQNKEICSWYNGMICIIFCFIILKLYLYTCQINKKSIQEKLH